jgi:hypothetical protein
MIYVSVVMYTASYIAVGREWIVFHASLSLLVVCVATALAHSVIMVQHHVFLFVTLCVYIYIIAPIYCSR